MADTRDLKSLAVRRAGSSPAGGTHPNKETKVQYEPPKIITIKPDHDLPTINDRDPAPEFSDAVALFLLILFVIGFWVAVGLLIHYHLF